MKSKDDIIYLDYAAACPMDPECLDWMEGALEPGNPSSIHRLGQKKRQKIDEARAIFQTLLGAKSEKEITFYGSGTEAIWSALMGMALCFPEGSHILASASEHSAVVETLRLLESHFKMKIEWVNPRENGRHDIHDFEKKSTENTKLWVMMAVNNETGVKQDILSFALAAKEKGILTFCDACQLGAREKVTIEKYPVDALVLNSAKVYGPIGCGALYKRESVPFQAMMTGGGQEFRRRGGTENAEALFAFAKAFEKCQKLEDQEKIQELSRFFESELEKIEGLEIIGEHRVPGLWTLYVPWMSGEALVMRMDLEGFAISTGSACSSGVTKLSPVILSMGIPEEKAQNMIRISLGRWTEKNHLEKWIQSLLFIRESLL